ncbi:glycosyl hydrolase [Piscinibacter terrae]|uniref:GH26 domain-containing protein n=1 Tax=Piscinibacter terrae TaxID=2496871 RepID=A0A3N7HZ41_9BURK|nr:glycosyl hydrolase [Albitalea terrae]RQP26706.1 hypothetical protein DZC73_06835 [Albitalea terrae]
MSIRTTALTGHETGTRALKVWFAVATVAAACAAASVAHADTIYTRPNDGSTARLSDPAATQETQNAYSFIKTRTSKGSSNMILGQHMGGPGEMNQTSVSFDMPTFRIDSATNGRHAYPRLIGARYDSNVGKDNYLLDAGLIDQINTRLIEVSNIYHPIVAITATPRNPWHQASGRDYFDGQGPLGQLAYANRATGPAKLFWDEIDTIADGLAKLKTADGKPIPVLFRPFAEFNTGDKYYGPNSNPQQNQTQHPQEFVALWREVANYYVNQRHLHNLIFTWEAWVWNRRHDEVAVLGPWFPAASSPTDKLWVDVVAGAFYFDPVDPRFSLDFTNDPVPNDEKVFYSLMNLAITNNKPFGAAQWSVNYTKPGEACVQGDNRNAQQFMTSVDNRHYVATPTTQHLSFVYYWADDNNGYCMSMNRQLHSTEFADDPRVASITGIDAINTESGRVVESKDGGTGGQIQQGLPLRTGDTVLNRQVKSVLSFDTSSSTLPVNAVLSDAPASVVLKKNLASDAMPTTLADLGIEAAAVLGASTSLALDDFNAIATMLPGRISDPKASYRGQVAYGQVPSANVNRAGRTQLRLAFKLATDGNGAGNQIDWVGQTTSGPELILSYTLPNANP